ncbi:hypothetical protein MBLNU230_g7767t1 [Neophaeotheca triangularis]
MDESMEASAFEMDNSAGSDFDPEPVPVKAKAKAPAKKAPAAAKAKPATKQTTLKPTKAAASKPAPKKRSKPESDDENSEDGDSADDQSLLSNTPPSKKQKKAPEPKKASTKNPLTEMENESVGEATPMSAMKAKAKKGGATDQYQKLTQLEHILKRPDTYIGSVEPTTEQMWVFNSEAEMMENRKVTFVPGLYKIFDEILVNAADNKQRDKNMDEMRVWINREQGVIAVRNNGRGIPIEMHSKEGIWIPEMIFGHLLTSSNYDDDQAKVTGGRNGYGAKLTNIYSTQFSLETVDSKTKQKYKQTWKNNMGNMEKAKITPMKTGSDYTQITFKPDFRKFGMDEMDDDFEAIVKRRVYDMAGTAKGVKVYLNDQRIKINKFKQYMEMYTKAIKTENIADNGAAPEQVILTDNPHERWEIGFAVSDGSFQQVSFVNSIATTHGGSHVNFIADQIVEQLAQIVKKKNKGGVTLKPAQIKNHMFLFVNALIVNPSFTSQTKEQLTTRSNAFGSKPTVSEKFLKDIAKTDVVSNILHFAQQKADKVLAKSDGNRRQRMNNPKLTDANKAGTKDGWKCTLILTEGDSASLLALAGRAVVNPDLFGVFPLRGKLLNVRDASVDQITKNAEIQNIKKFMGLQHKKEYNDTKSLRYGHLMIMTDQDHDGSHIKGLLINFLQVQFPSLLKLPGFLMEFITPIVRVWKGDQKHPKAKRDFFTMPEYEAWRLEPGHDKGWDHKYYKGLGTSDTSDAEIYFADLDKHLKQFHTMQQGEPDMIDLAFSKKKADARKGWLQNYVPGTYLDMSGTDQITYDDFINKELILFSMADNMRSIPSVVDGFKPGQRKVLYTCFRRNLKKDVKVVELAGSVSGLTAYAYGDTSLQQTIVGLAQNFVGSNNINCLVPSGNFGSRLQGGQDAASARYIYTRLSPFARRIFHQTDEALLQYNLDDGKTIEPEIYVPIVPMILINGADGIGTGWSTTIPNFNPADIIENLKRRMRGSSKDDMENMKPWFRGWTGEAEQIGEDRFRFSGVVTRTGDNEVEVTELPVRLWTQDFKERLEEIIKSEKVPSFIKDYTEYNTPTKVHFIIKMEEKEVKLSMSKEGGLEDMFKLSKTMATTNLVAFDRHGRIHKYATVLDIMEEFYHIRLEYYQKRKAYMLGEMELVLKKLTNQARFVKMIIDGKLSVSRKKKSALVAELQKLGFDRFPKATDAKKTGEFEAVVEDENADEADDAETAAGATDYDYLLGMAIWSLTQERVERLNRQIGDKEDEITILTKLSAKDLWTKDLDELLEEWQNQLDDDAKIAKKSKSKSKGRRASAKLGIGGGKGKKRKAGDDSDFDDDSDSDFGPKKVKAAAAKTKKATGGLLGVKVEAKSSGVAGLANMINSVEQKPVSKPPAEQMTLDSAFEVKAVPKAATEASKKAPPKVQEIDSDDEDVFAAVAAEEPAPAARTTTRPRKAAPKVVSDEDESEEFVDAEEAPAPKPAAKPARTAASKKAPAKAPSPAEDDDFMDIDGNDDNVPSKAAAKPSKAPSKSAAAKKAPAKSAMDNDDMDVDNEPVKPAARRARGAAAQKPNYALSDDSEPDAGDNKLDDVSTMVKGIGAGTTTEGATRFFHPQSVSRPSSRGVKNDKKIGAGADISDDETDWGALAQNSPQKIGHTAMGSDDDSLLSLRESRPAPKAAATKPGAAKTTAASSKTNGTLKPKKAPAPAALEPKTLSPAAKAYKKKQEAAQAKTGATAAATSKPKAAPKKKKVQESSDLEDADELADEILGEDGESDAEEEAPVPKPVAVSGRPSRRAAAAPAKSKYVVDDDDEDESEQDESATFDDGDESD